MFSIYLHKSPLGFFGFKTSSSDIDTVSLDGPANGDTAAIRPCGDVGCDGTRVSSCNFLILSNKFPKITAVHKLMLNAPFLVNASTPSNFLSIDEDVIEIKKIENIYKHFF